MKKGFTMIELIFVIVILGILASVAIPRLASTRADAEISAAIGNLRTLLSDASQYYVVKGSFGTSKYKEFTNVALKTSAGADIGNQQAVDTKANAFIKVADVNDCIGVHFLEKSGNRPALIKITAKESPAGVCKQVLDTPAVQAYTKSSISYTEGGATKTESAAIAIGSNTEVYGTTTTTPEPDPKP